MSSTTVTTAPTELAVLAPPAETHAAGLNLTSQAESSQTHGDRNFDEDHEPAPGGNIAEAIPDGGYGWTIVAASSFLTFWLNGYTTAWGIFQTAIVKSPRLHTDLRTITFVGSLYMACIVAFGLVSIRLMRSYGVRYLAFAATIIFGLGLVATSFVLDNLGGLFCIAGALIGLGSSLVFAATNTLTLQWFSGRLGLANGTVKMGGGIGATVMPLISQALIDRVGLQWTFRILGALILFTGAPAALLLKERSRSGSASRFDWSLLKNPPFMALALAGAVGVFAMYVPPYFLPLFASSIGLSSSVGAGLVAGFGAATAIGRLLGGWFCDRVGAVNALAITTLINSLSMFAIWPVSESLPPLFIFALINGCANGSFFVTLPTAVAMIAPGSAAASISLMTFFWTPGYLFGAPLAGILIEASGAADATSIGPYRGAIFYSAGVGALATVLVLVSRWRLDHKVWKKL
jgi:MFS family permease